MRWLLCCVAICLAGCATVDISHVQRGVTRAVVEKNLRPRHTTKLAEGRFDVEYEYSEPIPKDQQTSHVEWRAVHYDSILALPLMLVGLLPPVAPQTVTKTHRRMRLVVTYQDDLVRSFYTQAIAPPPDPKAPEKDTEAKWRDAKRVHGR